MEFLDLGKASKKSLKRLSRVSTSIDRFCKKHPKKMSSRQHRKLRKMLTRRASVLSDCLGVKVHSLFV